MSFVRILAARLRNRKLAWVAVRAVAIAAGRHYRHADVRRNEPVAPVAAAASVIGFIDKVQDGGQGIAVSGWALSQDGVREVALVVNGQTRIPAHTGVSRHDAAADHAGYPDAAQSGFEGTTILSPRPRDYRALVLQTDAPTQTCISVSAQQTDGHWVTLVASLSLSLPLPLPLASALDTPAGRVLAPPTIETQFTRLGIAWAGNAQPQFAIRQVVLYPR